METHYRKLWKSWIQLDIAASLFNKNCLRERVLANCSAKVALKCKVVCKAMF